MSEYLIKWDAGYGDSYDVIEANSLREAEVAAYEAWKDDVESNADYSAQELTDEIREEYGV